MLIVLKTVCQIPMIMKLFKTSLVFLLSLFILETKAQETFVINKTNQTLYPAIKAEYFEDKGAKLTFREVQKQQFIKNGKTDLNFGYTSSAYWVRLKIKNETNENDWRLLSFIIYHNLLDFWIEDGKGGWKHIHTGWKYPYASRQNFEHVGFTFPLDIPKGEERIIYFRLEGIDPFTFPLELIQKEQLAYRYQKENIYYGLYFGILLTMMLYNLFIWFSLRDKNYIYYFFSIFCIFITFASVSGYPFKYLYPDIPEINRDLTRVFSALNTIFTGLFIIHFLELKKYLRWAYYIILFDILIAIPVIFLAISEIHLSAINDMNSFHAPFLLIVGIVSWIKGNKTARFYTFAWASFLIGATFILMRNEGILPVNFITTHAPEVGSALEVVLLSLALANRYRRLRKEKEAATRKTLEIERQAKEGLEEKVKERTLELQEQSLELQERNDELNQMNEELDTALYTMGLQKNEIEQQNTLIQSSINYAQRIQRAILPSEKMIQATLSDAFVLFRPRDVVSGDFYYLRKEEHRTILILADCTGHGVPGALMSMMGVNLIERVFAENEEIMPNEALQKIDKYLAQTLSVSENNIQDGMDMALCIIEPAKQKLWFSGAKQSLIKIRDQQDHIYKKSAQAVGGRIRMNLFKIPLHEIHYTSEDRFYMFSDGYQDQFGGEEGKKFMRIRFRELLIKSSILSCANQREKLDLELDNWILQGNEKQTDDILVIGFTP